MLKKALRPLLVVGICIGMQKQDRDRFDAVLQQLIGNGTQFALVERNENVA